MSNTNPPAAEQPKEAAKKSSAAALKKARVLVDCEIDGKPYKVNAVAEASAEDIKNAEAQGRVDSNKAAVAYAESLKA